MTREEVIAALALGIDQRDQAEQRIFAAVEAAADAGIEWDEIGRALGMEAREAWDWVHPMVDRMPEPPGWWFMPAARR